MHQSVLLDRLLEHPEILGVKQLQLIETHSSFVLLGDDSFAFKIKKEVNLGFLDYSSLSKRKQACLRELEFNSRFCSSIYLGVIALGTRGDQVVLEEDLESDACSEFAVKMNQFDRELEFSRLLEQGRLTLEHLQSLAVKVASSHSKLPREFGRDQVVLEAMRDNIKTLEKLLFESHVMDSDSGREIMEQVSFVWAWFQDKFDSLAQFFVERKQGGFIRQCHGDLHLGNCTLYRNEVEMFDCIEFNEDFIHIDVIQDVSFMIMDLEVNRKPDLAIEFLNTYLQYSGDYEGLRALNLYCTYKAFIRAKVHGITILNSPHCDPKENLEHMKSYISLASKFISRDPSFIALMHGPSGSGKSFVAKKLSRASESIHVIADVERKRLFGIGPLDSSRALSEDIYSKEASERTYARLGEVAKTSVESGFSAICDATFLQRRTRRLLASVALSLEVPCVIVECTASRPRLLERIQSRTGDPSEATEKVLEMQLESMSLDDHCLDEEELARVISIDTETEYDISLIVERMRKA
jgi:aminoglycoside phosphotransferase family enzyme/predicted kinase